MIRVFDIIFSLIGLLVLSPILFIIIIIGWFDTKSPLFIQTRVGMNKKPFKLIKFRTMRVDTIHIATHLVNKNSVTKFGSFLRRTKLDELPQLVNVLIGQMSLVGPRPNLFNQDEIISHRSDLNVYSVKPGITGLSQINNIDMSKPKLLAQKDAQMIKHLSITTYFSILFLTIKGNGYGDPINYLKR